MGNSGLTASSVITFAKEVEDRTSSFYEALAEAFPQQEELFLVFAKRARRNRTAVTRTYQETVSDALETSFSFRDVDLTSYCLDVTLGENPRLVEALEKAIRLEENAVRFYQDVADRSEGLLATIPMMFARVARERRKRKEKLQSLRG